MPTHDGCTDDFDDMDEIYADMQERIRKGTATEADFRDLPEHLHPAYPSTSVNGKAELGDWVMVEHNASENDDDEERAFSYFESGGDTAAEDEHDSQYEDDEQEVIEQDPDSLAEYEDEVEFEDYDAVSPIASSEDEEENVSIRAPFAHRYYIDPHTGQHWCLRLDCPGCEYAFSDPCSGAKAACDEVVDRAVQERQRTREKASCRPFLNGAQSPLRQVICVHEVWPGSVPEPELEEGKVIVFTGGRVLPVNLSHGKQCFYCEQEFADFTEPEKIIHRHECWSGWTACGVTIAYFDRDPYENDWGSDPTNPSNKCSMCHALIGHLYDDKKRSHIISCYHAELPKLPTGCPTCKRTWKDIPSCEWSDAAHHTARIDHFINCWYDCSSKTPAIHSTIHMVAKQDQALVVSENTATRAVEDVDSWLPPPGFSETDETKSDGWNDAVDVAPVNAASAEFAKETVHDVDDWLPPPGFSDIEDVAASEDSSNISDVTSSEADKNEVTLEVIDDVDSWLPPPGFTDTLNTTTDSSSNDTYAGTSTLTVGAGLGPEVAQVEDTSSKPLRGNSDNESSSTDDQDILSTTDTDIIPDRVLAANSDAKKQQPQATTVDKKPELGAGRIEWQKRRCYQYEKYCTYKYFIQPQCAEYRTLHKPHATPTKKVPPDFLIRASTRSNRYRPVKLPEWQLEKYFLGGLKRKQVTPEKQLGNASNMPIPQVFHVHQDGTMFTEKGVPKNLVDMNDDERRTFMVKQIIRAKKWAIQKETMHKEDFPYNYKITWEEVQCGLSDLDEDILTLMCKKSKIVAKPSTVTEAPTTLQKVVALSTLVGSSMSPNKDGTPPTTLKSSTTSKEAVVPSTSAALTINTPSQPRCVPVQSKSPGTVNQTARRTVQGVQLVQAPSVDADGKSSKSDKVAGSRTQKQTLMAVVPNHPSTRRTIQFGDAPPVTIRGHTTLPDRVVVPPTQASSRSSETSARLNRSSQVSPTATSFTSEIKELRIENTVLKQATPNRESLTSKKADGYEKESVKHRVQENSTCAEKVVKNKNMAEMTKAIKEKISGRKPIGMLPSKRSPSNQEWESSKKIAKMGDKKEKIGEKKMDAESSKTVPQHAGGNDDKSPSLCSQNVIIEEQSVNTPNEPAQTPDSIAEEMTKEVATNLIQMVHIENIGDEELEEMDPNCPFNIQQRTLRGAETFSYWTTMEARLAKEDLAHTTSNGAQNDLPSSTAETPTAVPIPKVPGTSIMHYAVRLGMAAFSMAVPIGIYLTRLKL